MGYAIHQDMQEVYNNPDKWINHGRDALINSCHHTSQDESEKKENRTFNIAYSGYCSECDVSEDSAIPMMNYLYPLELNNFDEDKILKVVKETNCSVLENSDTGEWFLVLCGGGMDLSQDIALSYVILEKWIPQDLLNDVCKQPLLSLGSKNYKFLAREIISQLKSNIDRFRLKKIEWKESLKNLKEQEKQKEHKKVLEMAKTENY